ncbi:PAN domain-containing protein At5g03700-like [Telopea speciosissima]|uniref:PAN domain-containing protein At5g03700-like n=1 Tax=Telopea speciosissima TaxID=54955 RepID=UPI001CC4A9CE|nr:PAN domain-containing protein At5g03700-like [Telopea speciosissima]
MERFTGQTVLSLGFLLQLIAFLLFLNQTCLSVVAATPVRLIRGFTATPYPSVSSFQPLLDNPNGTFSLGFLRNGSSQLALAIVHVPSSEPVWLANPNRSALWSNPTELSFNGSLVLYDRHSGVLWSTETIGDFIILLDNGNLQIQKFDGLPSLLWQSFDFPSDTLLDNQNFTVNMSLVSSNSLYSMRMGDNFMGLYSNFKAGLEQIYWKHKAMEAKASIIVGNGPIYARISPDGFLGMYQTEEAPVDVQAFDTFQNSISGIRRLKLESDGNLRDYFWNGSNWVSDFQAIKDECELPNACGSYGLCIPGGGCSCLDNRTEYSSGGCLPQESGDICGTIDKEKADSYWVLTRTGVELPYKELMEFEKMGSLEECESSCERNCSCWGIVYNNASGFCYAVDYPINTLVSVGDESKIGYFKVIGIEEARKRGEGVGLAVGIALLIAAVVILVGVGGFMIFKIWRSKEEEGHGIFKKKEQGLSHMDLLRSSSSVSVELSTR